MSEAWVLIEDAPAEVHGIFWGPAVKRQWENPDWTGAYPTGHVKVSDRTGKRKPIANWPAEGLTHFAPHPPPPTLPCEEE